jgi:hypothetical protein
MGAFLEAGGVEVCLTDATFLGKKKVSLTGSVAGRRSHRNKIGNYLNIIDYL